MTGDDVLESTLPALLALVAVEPDAETGGLDDRGRGRSHGGGHRQISFSTVPSRRGKTHSPTSNAPIAQTDAIPTASQPAHWSLKKAVRYRSKMPASGLRANRSPALPPMR